MSKEIGDIDTLVEAVVLTIEKRPMEISSDRRRFRIIGKVVGRIPRG